MASRLELHEELCKILETRNVYFQPPESLKMQYPCIRYSMSGVDTKRANNAAYRNTNQYEVIVIDKSPDSTIFEKIIARFPMCRYNRWYTADNLNHYVLTLYF